MITLLLLLTVLQISVFSANPIHFLFNNRNYNDFRNNIYVDTNNASSVVNLNLPFIFIIHGYLQTGNVSLYQQMLMEYLKKGDFNIIRVDWSNLADGLYTSAASNTNIVGVHVAQFIIYLKQNLGINLNAVHLIGHSLGAHVAGESGFFINQTLNQTIARITGLDPAGPGFGALGPYRRLSSLDAQMVDVLHTTGFIFGLYQDIGTVDFYANGGAFFQPGCLANRALSNAAPNRIILNYIFCSHVDSVRYFIASINSNRFIGTCRRNSVCAPDITATFGNNIAPGTIGIYDFETNSRIL